MLSTIKKIEKEIASCIISNIEEAESFRLKYISKNGLISKLFEDFKHISPDEKKNLGQALNFLKKTATEKLEAFKESSNISNQVHQNIDLTLPSESFPLGSRHPISIIRNEITDIFSRIGFTVAEGPEIEDDWHNFSGLNFASDHPARDMQDTFFVQTKPEILLRTHTSSVQIRVMENEKPPIRKIFPGRVFRNEAISARSHCIFHQIEGLYIDKNVSFADLKQTLLYFARELFGSKTNIRLRPSFFPFTEPSAEMDISCTICSGKGCNLCKHTGFLEILGCGMVDPNVLQSTNINNTEYTGFAFGMGLERIALLKYRINDIRLYFENDIRFLKQFYSSF
ncbi:MAG: phenylalanine--tRNA ligase subunit alpha [Bacteroidales bacterium]